jgi:hypothetical protein
MAGKILEPRRLQKGRGVKSHRLHNLVTRGKRVRFNCERILW